MMKPALMKSGVAPLIATSFTVPLTASAPMLPPGKKRGRTTNESVEYAIRPGGRVRTAESVMRSSTGLVKAGLKR
jgi:hypothetical protein